MSGELQDNARLAPSTVTGISTGEVKPVRKQRRRGKQKSSSVRSKSLHPALKMAHDLGIDPRRIEITAEPPLWGCIIHNQPLANRKSD